MRPLRIIIANLLVAAGLAGVTPAMAIIAGEPAREPQGLRSFTVRIESSRGEMCSGVAIDTQSVLTAAHCVLGGGRFTIISLSPEFRARRHAISRILPHPSFVPGTTPRTQPGVDLAVIRLAAPLPADMTPLSPGGGLWAGEPLTIAGFGLGVEGRPGSARQLRSARLVSAGAYTSANTVAVAVDEARRGASVGAGACRGDSGGPALKGGADSRDLAGIVSWSSGPLGGRGRQVCGGFTSITPIAEHARWISATSAALAAGQSLAPSASASLPGAAPAIATGGNASIIER